MVPVFTAKSTQALTESVVCLGSLQTSIMKIFQNNDLYIKVPSHTSGSTSLVNKYLAVEEKMCSGYNMVLAQERIMKSWKL